MLDSGAQQTVVSDVVAQRLGYNIQHLDKGDHLIDIQWGDGSTVKVDKLAELGTITALVLPDSKLHDTLISVANIVDTNHEVTFSRTQAIITNTFNNQTNLYPRDESTGLWRMPVNDLPMLSANQFDPQCQDCVAITFSARLRSNQGIRQRVLDLHHRMAHASESSMCSAVSGNDPVWRQAGVTEQQIRQVFRHEPCLDCALCKRNLQPARVRLPEDHRAWKPGQCLCIDPIPTVTPRAMDGEVSFFTVTCRATGRLHNIATMTKSSEAYIEVLEVVYRYYLRYGYKVEVVRTDAEFNLRSDKVDKFLASLQITLEHSAPYRHHQNGAERYIQTILKGTSTILHAQPWLRADMWVYALNAFTDAYNNTPNKLSGNKTPNYLINKQCVELDRTFLFSFGDFVVAGIPKEHRTWKFDARNTLCIYLGQPAGAVDSHLLFEPYSHKVIERGSVTKIDISDLDYLRHYSNRFNMREGSTPYQIIDDAIYDFSLDLLSIDTAEPMDQSEQHHNSDEEEQQPHPQTVSKSLRRSFDTANADNYDIEKPNIPSVLDGRSKPKQRSPRRIRRD